MMFLKALGISMIIAGCFALVLSVIELINVLLIMGYDVFNPFTKGILAFMFLVATIYGILWLDKDVES